MEKAATHALIIWNCCFLSLSEAFDSSLPTSQIINWSTVWDKTFEINGRETLIRGRTGWEEIVTTNSQDIEQS